MNGPENIIHDSYADIIIDISVEALDKTFQYRIPDRLQSKVSIGSKVNISFGKGDRKITGYVVKISDRAKIDVSKIKDIDSVCDKQINIDDRMVGLAFWMKEQFGSTANEALKCVIPVKRIIKNKVERQIIPIASVDVLTDEKVKAAKRHATGKVRLIEELIEEYETGLKYELVTQKLNIAPATINSMVKDGNIRIDSKTSYRSSLGKACEDSAVPGQKNGSLQIELNDEQKAVSDSIIADYRQGKNGKYLIHGITGSGKTEVYMAVIEEVIASGKSVIMLIPEISLTYQTVKRFYRRFGDSISVINSRLSAGERYDQYLRAKNGETKIVIGPRSAVFTPFDNLGLIIIDEEHEGSYKSEQSPRYSTRDVAFRRSDTEGAMVILGSATPSLESYSAAESGRLRLFELKSRAGGAELPKVWIADLREELKNRNRSIFSYKLRELMTDRLSKKEQIMLFINRRGLSGFVNCRSCGFVFKCPHCDVSLNLHNNGRLVCHYCGYEEPMVKNCPKCGSPYVSTFGIGTQKVEEILNKEFPSARVLRMDSDTTRQKESYDEILSKFANFEADILVGTQMIVKGHDFHKVTLVGILLADMSLHSSDYRSGEITFDLLSQAAGRAGRGDMKGDVVIQTYNPEHYAIISAAEHDYKGFYYEEISFRKLMNYPPSWTMLKIMLLSEDEKKLLSETERFTVVLKDMLTGRKKVKLFGPSKAIVYKLNDIYRMVYYLKSADYAELVSIKDELGDKPFREKDVSIQLDFNPQ